LVGSNSGADYSSLQGAPAVRCWQTLVSWYITCNAHTSSTERDRSTQTAHSSLFLSSGLSRSPSALLTSIPIPIKFG
jgi:hypothetical protein